MWPPSAAESAVASASASGARGATQTRRHLRQSAGGVADGGGDNIGLLVTAWLEFCYYYYYRL